MTFLFIMHALKPTEFYPEAPLRVSRPWLRTRGLVRLRATYLYSPWFYFLISKLEIIIVLLSLAVVRDKMID